MTAEICIIGAGSLGQSFAALLAQSGQAVTLLATPRTAAQLLEAGNVRLRETVTITVPAAPAPAPPGTVGVTADPKDLPAGAGVIFMTKGHQLAEAIETVRAVWPKADDRAAWVAGVQNGMAKDPMLAAAFGAERVVGGATILGAERQADGGVRVTALGMTFLGELTGDEHPRAGEAVAALQRAGIPAQVPADINSVLWTKACNAAGVFGVSVLARAIGPEIFQSYDLAHAYLTLVRETADLAAAHGVTVGDYENFPPIHSYAYRPFEETMKERVKLRPPGTPRVQNASLPSMTQDLLAGRPMEVEVVFGDFVARGERVGKEVPRLTLVRDLLRGLDDLNRAG